MDAGISEGIISFDIDINGNFIEATPKSFIKYEPCFRKIYKEMKKHRYDLKDFEKFKMIINRIDDNVRKKNKHN